ncbi:Snap25-like protein [Thalictrum thalictroides]|uniref:Snap25-like protein n=1 Tax=Thalictrum thalictroides TaxID=46969 RepID=A0A7J6W2G4_THATH|nr:Snap25-like protein [Thalictrum thalictroides]
MSGFRRSPLNKLENQTSVVPGFQTSSNYNPFDSDTDLETKKSLKPSTRTSLEPAQVNKKYNTNPFDDDEGRETVSSSSYSVTSERRNKYKNGFRHHGGLENQTVQELENYAVYKAEETTDAFNSCLKVAVDIREEATKTLVTLHQQGEQITRTHTNAADIEQDLSRGEKLLGSLGGLFSRTWKAKKTRSITGPILFRDDPIRTMGSHLEQKQRLGLLSGSKEQSRHQQQPAEPTNTLERVEVEKTKQDDALNDLSNILDELKVMAIDMGSEIGRQNKALDHFHDDVEELSVRVKDNPHFNFQALSKKAMDLLHKLDFIQGGDPMIRDGKRSISRDLVRFLEFVDGISAKRQQLSSKSIKAVRFADEIEKSRVYMSTQEPFSCENVGDFDYEQGISSDDQTELVEKLTKKIGNIEGFSRVYEDDEEETGSEGSSSKLSNGDRNPRINLKTKVNHGKGNHFQGQNGNSLYSAPLPVQMEPIRDDQMKERKDCKR